MKVLLVYNPNSGNQTFKNYLDFVVEKFQRKGYLVTLYRIDEHCDLLDLFETTDLSDYKKILIAGGDGTIHQAVNALFAKGIPIPIGIYPSGTANDFAHNFNLPLSIEELTEIYTKDNYTWCDVGMVNGKYFINVASLGCLVDISQRTDPKAKTNFGVFSYYLKGIEEFQKLRTIKVRVQSDAFFFEDEIYFMLIMNGKSAGGFKKIAPFSVINDGLFDVYIFKKCPLLELMNLVTKILKGEHAQNPNVLYFQTSKLTVECDEKIGTDLDGERGVAFPLNIEVIPNKLKISIPNDKNTIGSH